MFPYCVIEKRFLFSWPPPVLTQSFTKSDTFANIDSPRWRYEHVNHLHLVKSTGSYTTLKFSSEESNLDFGLQRPMCYHYTTGESTIYRIWTDEAFATHLECAPVDRLGKMVMPATWFEHVRTLHTKRLKRSSLTARTHWRTRCGDWTRGRLWIRQVLYH